MSETLAGEPTAWHARYVAYRDLGPPRRLVAAYARCFDGTRQPPEPAASWYDAADRWHWRERAMAWDRERAAEAARIAAETVERDKAERLALLKATRGKLVSALNATAATDEGFGRIVAQVATLTEQLRKESEE